MNQRIKQLAEQSSFLNQEEESIGYFAKLLIQDNIQTLRNNGYDDAADCLHDVHFGMDDPV